MKLFFKKYWAEIINSVIAFIMLIVLPITYKPLREMYLFGIENNFWFLIKALASMLVIFTIPLLPWEKWYKKIKRP